MGKDAFTSEWYDEVSELIKNHQIEVLDIIAFERTGKHPYYHYGVVISPVIESDGINTDYNCIHVTTHGGQHGRSSSSSSTSSGPGGAQVLIQKLSEIADWTSKPSRVRIHNLRERQEQGAKERIQEAIGMVGKDFKYKVHQSNCEHFANKLRSDLKFSLQVLNFFLGIFGIPQL